MSINRLEASMVDTTYVDLVEIVEKRFGIDAIKRHPDLLFTNDHCHPNPLGHRLIGDALADKILALIE